jgi:hypothetical protein
LKISAALIHCNTLKLFLCIRKSNKFFTCTQIVSFFGSQIEICIRVKWLNANKATIIKCHFPCHRFLSSFYCFAFQFFFMCLLPYMAGWKWKNIKETASSALSLCLSRRQCEKRNKKIEMNRISSRSERVQKKMSIMRTNLAS